MTLSLRTSLLGSLLSGGLLSLGVLTTAWALSPGSASAESVSAPRTIQIVVENGTYKPARVLVTEGEKIRLEFLRKEHNACTKDVVFPSLNIKRELPPNKPISIDLPELKVGELAFHCGMNMVKGAVVVEAKK